MPYELIDTEPGLIAIGEEWLALEQRARVRWLFQHHPFCESFYRIVGQGARVGLACVAYREDQTLRAILPLSVVRQHGIHILSWLGSLHLVDHGDVLYDPGCTVPVEEFMRESLALIRQRVRYDVRYFGKVRRDAASYSFLAGNFSPLRSYRCRYIRLKGTFGSYLESLRVQRKKLKSDTLRQMRRLSALGTLRYEMIDHSDCKRMLETLAVLLAQKSARYGDTFLLPDSGYAALVEQQALTLPGSHVSRLTLNHEIIATHFGYIYDGHYIMTYPTFRLDYAKYSPGRVLIYHLIQESYQRNLQYFDFGMGEESYKSEWGNESIDGFSFIGTNLIERVIGFCQRCGGRL